MMLVTTVIANAVRNGGASDAEKFRQTVRVGDWIQFYNHRRPHQALGMKTPAEAYALAA